MKKENEGEGQLTFKETLEFNKGKLKVVNEPVTNGVSTIRYTLVNFLPKVMLQLFMRHVYIFFLAISIVNFVPSNLDAFRVGVFEIPLGVSALIFILKELGLELARIRSDEEINSQKTRLCTDDNEGRLIRYD
jgi:hypothetical protein